MPSIQYRVKAGDTLYGLSRRYKVTIEELCRLNRIRDANLIFVGQVLQIPSRQPPSTPPGRQTSSTIPSARANRPGEVIFGFHGTFPSERELTARMAGFRRWAIFTLEQPVTELARHSQHGSMPFVFDHSPALAGQSWLPPQAFQPAATRAEMTFRHTRPGGNVLQVGTDRISTGNNLVRILEASQGRGTGQIVRIDPSVVSRNGQTFLSARDVLADLSEFEQVTQRELKEATQAGRGRTHIDRLRNRLNGIRQARGIGGALGADWVYARINAQ